MRAAPIPPETPRVALVHDYLLVMRGAERTFAQIASYWPDAPVYTLLHDPKVTNGFLGGHEIRTSGLQHLGVRQRGFRRLLPLLPGAVERLPVQHAELVVSSSSAFAHGVRPATGAAHICYCHSPFRYAWHERARALAEAPRPARPVLGRLLDRVQRWDLEATERVTRYVANSEITRRRIQDFWGRDSVVIQPPVDVHRFSPAVVENYLLLVGELVPHKRRAEALEAARRAGLRTKVVGTGPELERLRARFGDTAEFLGRVSDAELDSLYASALAFVQPNVEEFGIAAVEAQAAGRPVVALDAGGARETVIDGVTGVLVPPGDPDGLAEALADTDFERFHANAIREHAARFSPAAFAERFIAEMGDAIGLEKSSTEARESSRSGLL